MAIEKGTEMKWHPMLLALVIVIATAVDVGLALFVVWAAAKIVKTVWE